MTLTASVVLTSADVWIHLAMAVLSWVGPATPDVGRASTSTDSADTEVAATPEAEAPDPDPSADKDPLRVAVAGSAPFVVEQDGAPHGISVSFWHSVATRAEIAYELELAESIPAALSGVADGTYDLAVGPISITAERAESVAFTQPYYESPLSIVTSSDSTSAWDRVRPFFTKAFIVGVGVLMLVLGIVGVLLWWTEKDANPEQFPKTPLHGIANGLWLALVTMTTVGYGDKAPVTMKGRFVAGVWMLIAMLFASSLTASIATAFTLSQLGGGTIGSAEELSGRRVAVVGGSPGDAFAKRHGARTVPVGDVPSALKLIRRGEVEAVVHDRAVIDYELQQLQASDSEAAELVLAPGEYEPRGYGFAMPYGSALGHRIDLAVLEAKESGVLQELME